MATKVGSTLLAATSNAAGSTTTSATLNMSAAETGFITAQVTNGSPGPGAPCVATVNVSPDGATFYPAYSATAQIGNSVVSTFLFEFPPATMYANVTFSGNTTNAVTVAAQSQIETAF